MRGDEPPEKRKKVAPRAEPGAGAKQGASPKAKPRAKAKPPARSRLKPAEREAMFARLKAQRPRPVAELLYDDPFTLLVAVALSAQATDKGVNRATRGLFRAAPTPAAMLALGVEGVGEHIRTIGLWRNKARHVVALSEALIARFGGQVPEDRDALVTLPGVGRKTANVVLNMAFGQPTMAVDTHILRLGNRIGLAPGKTPEDVERGLLRWVPEPYLLDAHHWLILHGRYVCRARRPLCEHCVIADLCKSKDKTSDEPAPIREAPPNGPLPWMTEPPEAS